MTIETMVQQRSDRGFTLVEVIVALTIMSLMMVGLLAYVQSASELWQRGQGSFALRAYYRAVSEAIERDLSQATRVHNSIGSCADELRYDILIKQGTVYGTATVALKKEDDILMRRLGAVSSAFTISSGGADNQVNRLRYEYAVARNVATFSVTRISPYSLAVNLGLRSVFASEDAGSESFKNATMTFVVISGK